MGMTFVEALEAEAIEQLQAIRDFRTYSGTNVEYRQRAKLAIGVIGAYVRLRATMANERSNDLIQQRLLAGAPLPPSLPAAGQLRARD